jgi:Xaa-Pro aminopeptidase
MAELDAKLATVRAAVEREGLAAVRLRGTDWFAWATCGGSNTVLLTTDTGVAEVLITARGIWVLTDVIEEARLAQEELPAGIPLVACPWTERPAALDAAVHELSGGGRVASDRPAAGEVPLPRQLVEARWSLLPPEIDRYRALGRDAAAALHEVMREAKPEWTGFELAGAGAEALWSRGIEPALTLVAGERRLPVHRHATASAERLGSRAMMVFCARRHGLFANLTRFVYFRSPSAQERALDEAVAAVEGEILDALRPGATLGAIYDESVRAYARAGHPGGEKKHHQGGSCGYLSRDALALPGSKLALQRDNASAFNPSLPGAKIEDTVLVRDGGVEVLTVAAGWPMREVRGRQRPDLLVR